MQRFNKLASAIENIHDTHTVANENDFINPYFGE